MNDEKDRFGDKLRDVEKAREDQWAFEEDRKLIEKLRERVRAGDLLCPRCHKPLVAQARAGLTILACPGGEGAWLDKSGLDRVLKS